MEEIRNAYIVLLGKPEGKRPFQKHKHICIYVCVCVCVCEVVLKWVLEE